MSNICFFFKKIKLGCKIMVLRLFPYVSLHFTHRFTNLTAFLLFPPTPCSLSCGSPSMLQLSLQTHTQSPPKRGNVLFVLPSLPTTYSFISDTSTPPFPHIIPVCFHTIVSNPANSLQSFKGHFHFSNKVIWR